MTRNTSRLIRVGAAAAAVAGLVLAGMPGAQAAPQRASSAQTTLHVAITDKALYVDGPTSFPAGQVHLIFENARSKADGETAIFRLAPGYSWSDLRADIKTVGENLFAPHGDKQKGLKALNHAIAHLTSYGGLLAHAGDSVHGTLLLTDPGTYAIFNDSGQIPNSPHWLTVTAPAGYQALPPADGTVVAQTNRRFSGSSVLPANGTISFTNHSTESPHFLILQQVKEGTTRKQVIAALQSNSKPTFLLSGEFETDALTTNQSMDFHVSLPAGEYVQMCFFPDPKTGMPHALMGMVRVVHLK